MKRCFGLGDARIPSRTKRKVQVHPGGGETKTSCGCGGGGGDGDDDAVAAAAARRVHHPELDARQGKQDKDMSRWLSLGSCSFESCQCNPSNFLPTSPGCLQIGWLTDPAVLHNPWESRCREQCCGQSA